MCRDRTIYCDCCGAAGANLNTPRCFCFLNKGPEESFMFSVDTCERDECRKCRFHCRCAKGFLSTDESITLKMAQAGLAEAK